MIAVSDAPAKAPMTALVQFWNNIEIHLDEGIFAGSAAVLMAAMFLATIVPALRAARVDPIANLKEE